MAEQAPEQETVTYKIQEDLGDLTLRALSERSKSSHPEFVAALDNITDGVRATSLADTVQGQRD